MPDVQGGRWLHCILAFVQGDHLPFNLGAVRHKSSSTVTIVSDWYFGYCMLQCSLEYFAAVQVAVLAVCIHDINTQIQQKRLPTHYNYFGQHLFHGSRVLAVHCQQQYSSCTVLLMPFAVDSNTRERTRNKETGFNPPHPFPTATFIHYNNFVTFAVCYCLLSFQCYVCITVVRGSDNWRGELRKAM